MNDVIVRRLKDQFPQSIEATNEFRNDLTVQVKKQDIVKVCEFLKNDPDLTFDMIIDLCGADMYRPEGRFEVIYNLYSLKNRKYMRLKVLVDEEDPVVDTVSTVWAGANWHERETFDMYGINFEGHPDLRRMYMPEEYE
ncbi:MAG: NADH-quinone oxidoreductase subunit C, partial [Bacteroidota bacterium]